MSAADNSMTEVSLRRTHDEILRDLLQKSPDTAKHTLANLSNEKLQGIAARILTAQKKQRQERQLLFYQPVSEKSLQIHTTDARMIGVGGGNGSSKTETCLVEMVMCMTGVFPASVRPHIDISKKFRGPINCRVVCESLTTVLHPIILPKLQWWKWTGVSEPGGEKGHWGWIPRDCLVGGSWERSWSEKLRQLRVLCRDPETNQVVGESTIQFMSRDQDASDFASGDYHIVLHDEPPTLAIWRENQARTMRVRGRMMLAMTWPDDPAIPVDWIFDEVYEPANEGAEGKVWINLWTTENQNLDQEAVADQERDWDAKTADVRLRGKPIRFSNRVHALFTDQDDCWCFRCGTTTTPNDTTPTTCIKCGTADVAAFNHVKDFTTLSGWPCIWVIDPHPRKPHMYQWWQVDPSDDLWLVAEGECDGDPDQVKQDVDRIEKELHLHPTRRLIDPNMGRSPSSSTLRHLTWQDDFDAVGLVTDLADDSDVGRGRVNEYLRPDKHTLQPRLHIHPRCTRAIFQFKRYVWDDYKQSLDKAQKQKPKDKYDDDPTMAKYVLNTEPTFRGLRETGGVVRRRPELHAKRQRPMEMRWQIG